MAFFKFRKGGDDHSDAAVPPESVEAMRKRAKHRLIGAAILVLLGVIGFPLLVDKQPRPIELDIPIEIPDKDKVRPLVMPAPVLPTPVAPTPVDPVAQPSASSSGRVGNAPAPVVTRPAAAVVPKPAEKAPAQAAAVAEERFVVQVGAYAEVTRAREARLKLERAGLKTYTQVVETKEGRRIRVRLGPFATKAQADKAAERVKKLDLPASVLIL